MDRHDAVKVLREILIVCDGSLSMSNVSISQVGSPKEDGSFELKINCKLDDYLRKCVGAILEKHKLALKDLGNGFIIYRPGT